MIPIFLLLRPYLSLLDLSAIVLLHIALSSAYIQVYPASQATSPSLKILLLIKKSMPHGMAEIQIQKVFNPKELLETRIQDLVDSGLVWENGDKLALTSSGHALILPFVFLRQILGLPAGKG